MNESCDIIFEDLIQIMDESIKEADTFIKSFNSSGNLRLEDPNSLQVSLCKERDRLLRILDNIERMKEASNEIAKDNEDKTIFLCEWLNLYNNETNYKYYLSESRKKLTRIKVELINCIPMSSKDKQELEKLRIMNAELMTVKMNMKRHKILLERKAVQDIDQSLNYKRDKSLPFYPIRNECAKLISNLKQFSIYKHNSDLSMSREYTINLDCTLPDDCAIAYTTVQIFASGGKSQLFKTSIIHTHTFNITENGQLVFLKEMLLGRYSHNLIALNDNELYAIGGCIEESVTDQCEVYSIEENKWRVIDRLNKQRSLCSVCQVNQKKLYVFYGFKDIERNEIECSIESFNAQALKPKWRTINVSGVEEVKGLVNFGVGQIADKKILIFGGSSFEYKIPKKDLHLTALKHMQQP